jgi:hypothetical protein
MEARDILHEGVEVQIIRVFYSGYFGIGEESLGDGDIWIVSRNGYNRVGRLRAIERLEVPLPNLRKLTNPA